MYLCELETLLVLSLIALEAFIFCLHLKKAVHISKKEGIQKTFGMLYPCESETREVRSLDGIWSFVKSDKTNPNRGILNEWFKYDLGNVEKTIPMPVPASYNDITTSSELRDHVGTVWYDRKFFVPNSWENQLVWVRFGSVHYKAKVWINGELVVEHEIGHLPFEGEITKVLQFGQENRITVFCNNILTPTTVPQGQILTVETDSGNEIIQKYKFDFFNYSGIHRSVHLYTTPKVFIQDVEVTTDLSSELREGYVYYQVQVDNSNNEEIKNYLVKVKLKDQEGDIVAQESANSDLNGMLKVIKANFWWPYLMHSQPGYLYQLEMFLYSKEEEEEQLIDVYRMKVGIRTLRWDNASFKINDRPIYFRGLGKHEDSEIRGKGLDLALLTRDFNLLKWIGANSYRTAHYPYSEESMQFADEHGIMIIDECPSVDTDNYNESLLENHLSSMEQLIHRDRNRPSVVMWSIANEPRTWPPEADLYFEQVVSFTRNIDPSRPITAAIATLSSKDLIAKHMDVISFNRYYGWYSNSGRLDMITKFVIDEAISWNKKYNKPIIIGEYGADSYQGFHTLPSYIWSEEYQSELFSQHFKAFDILRKLPWFIGEFVWNFADFKTAQGYTRVGCNKKGVFTRDRQPKEVAYILRKRYFLLGKEIDHCSLPEDLFPYIKNDVSEETISKYLVSEL